MARVTPPRIESGRVRVLGYRLFYTSLGSPEQGTILVLHGGPGLNHRYLLPLFDLAPHGYRVVLYDQLGCGDSDRATDRSNYSFERAANEVEGIRRALRLGPVHLFGHSYGATLALEAVARHPRGFRSLILSSGLVASPAFTTKEWTRLVKSLPPISRRYLSRKNPDIDDQWEPAGKGQFRRHVPGYEKFARLHVFRRDTAPWELVLSEQHHHSDVFRRTWRSMEDWHGTGHEYDPSSAYSSVRVPCLVTVGRYDQLPVGISRFAARRIRNSHLVIFENSSHMPLWEERDRYMDTLRGFLHAVR